MKGLRFSIALLGALALAGCAKGSRGADGAPGPTGPTGPIGVAPQLDYVSLPFVTRNVQIVIVGSGFSSTPADNLVYFGTNKADVLQAQSDALLVTHAVAVDDTNDSHDLLLTVTVHGLTSNILPLVQIPPAQGFMTGNAQLDGIQTITVMPTGDILLSQSTSNHGPSVTKVDTTGKATTQYYLGATPQQTYVRGTSTWFWTVGGDLQRFDSNGVFVQVANIPGSTGVFDAAGNFYVNNNGTINKWDATTHLQSQLTVVTDGATNPVGCSSITLMGTSIFATDTTNGLIIEIPLATPATQTVYDTGFTGPSVLTNDGTNLYLYANGAIQKVTAANTHAAFSLLDAGGQPSSLGVDAAGHVFASYSNYVAKYVDDVTLTVWAEAVGARGFAQMGDRLFIGGSGLCGAADLPGDILYEWNVDGSMKRVTDGQCNASPTLAVANGKLIQVNSNTGNIESINPDSGAIALFYDNVTNAGIQNPYAVAADATGNVYVSGQDPANSQYVIAKLSSAGVLSNITFITNPDAGSFTLLAVQGTRIVAFDDDYELLRSAPLATGGAAAAIAQDAYTFIYTLNATATGDLLFEDNYAGYGTFYKLAADNTVTQLLPYLDPISSYDTVNMISNVDGTYSGFYQGEFYVVLP